MRLLLDADIAARGLIKGLSGRGHDVVAATDLPEHVYRDDETLLQQATELGRVLVTHNFQDFPEILRSWAEAERHHAGVILSSLPANEIGEILRRLDRVLATRSHGADWQDLSRWI